MKEQGKRLGRRFAGALLALVMVLGMLPGTVKTAEAATAEQIKSQITATYKTALSRSGRSSFNGYCATYVNWQLVILGINTSYVGGNGNDEYDNYKNKSNSSGGYSVAAYPASNYSVLSALNTITENGSKDAYNILIGFEKSIYGDGVTYGHTCFIHAILNGKVYYSESSQWTIDGAKVSEGTPIVQSISSFAQLYRSSNFTLDGVIHFGGTAPQPPDYTSIAAGTYYLRNKTAAYLNADGTTNKSNLSVASLKTAEAQRFVVSGGKSYSISASFDATLRVNPFSDTPTSGTNVNLYSGTEIGSDMHWCFEAVSGGYIIHNFSYPSLVLGLDGTNVRVETKSGADDQIWELIPATYTIYYNALGGSGAPAAQTKKFSENLTLSAAKPTLSGYTFKGWATTANAATAQYQPGGSYAVNGGATLYAVWEKEPEPVALTGITVASTPTKTVYEIGEALDTAGLTLTAAYSDGSTETVTSGYTVSGYDSAAAGEKTVTVTYEGKTASFTVTVREPQEGDWIPVDQVPEDAEIVNRKWVYDHHITSDKAEVSGYTLYNTTSKWSDYGGWSSWTTTSVNPSESRQVETKTVTDQAAYTEYTYYYYRYWNTSAEKYYYTYGSGMGGTKYTKTLTSPMVKGNVYDGFQSYTKSGGGYYNYSGEIWFLESSKNVAAKTHTEYRYRDRSLVYTYYLTREVTVYEPVAASESITNVRELVQYRKVEPVTLTGITVATAPAKTVYEIGEALDTAGLTLTAAYSDGSTKTVTEGYTVSGFDSAAAGEKTVTVTYEGKTASFTVTVNEAAPVTPPTDPAAAAVYAQTVSGRPGETVTLALSVRNNPGVAYLKLKVNYDSALELVSATNGGIINGTFTTSKTTEVKPYVLTWTGTENSTDSGCMAQLTFRIAEDAEDGAYTVMFDCDEAYNEEFDDVTFTMENATVEVKSFVYGDLNDDGSINGKDAILLARYLAEWDVLINMDAADVNADGKVNGKDAIVLARYLAEWDVTLGQ